MEYKVYPAPPVLQNYVRYFWSCDSFADKTPSVLFKSFADQFPRFVYQDLARFDSLKNGTGADVPACYVCGVDLKPTDAFLSGSFSHFGVSFYPHAINAIFKIGADEMLDEIACIGEFGRDSIREKLDRATSHPQRVEIMSRYLHDRLLRINRHESLVLSIVKDNGIDHETSLFALQKKYNISERQLERKFKNSIGISPKKFQRITRFDKSLQLLSTATYNDLGSISYQLNYADQSHFIKDFRAFSGMSPLEFIRKNNLGGDSASFMYDGE